MADDVAALCGPLGVERPVVFGHSAGGFVALHLALRRPDLVGGLIPCDTAPALLPLPDTDPAPALADRAPSAAMPAAARLFGGTSPRGPSKRSGAWSILTTQARTIRTCRRS